MERWGSLTVVFTGKFVYTTRHLTLPKFHPFGLRQGSCFDMQGSWFEQSASYLGLCLSAECATNAAWPWLTALQWWGSLTLAFNGKFVSIAHQFILLRLNPYGVKLDRWDGILSTPCHSGGFACQQRVLKMFPVLGYLSSKDGVVWLWRLLVNLCISLTISSCYSSIPLALGLIDRDGV